MENHIVCKLPDRSCTIDGQILDPKESQKIYNHSPDGFMWGYGCSGPAQLALAILYHVTGDRELSLRHYMVFKCLVISNLNIDADVNLYVDVKKWIKSQEKKWQIKDEF